MNNDTLHNIWKTNVHLQVAHGTDFIPVKQKGQIPGMIQDQFRQ